AGGVEPARDVGARARAPRVDGQRELWRPEEEEADRQEELVLDGEEQVDQAAEARDLPRRVRPPLVGGTSSRACGGLTAGGREAGLQLGEARARERLALETREDQRQRREIVARPLDGGEQARDAGAHAAVQNKDQRGGRGGGPVAEADRPPGDRADGEQRDRRRDETKPGGGRAALGAPRGDPFRIERRARTLAEDGQLLAQIDARAQLLDGGLPRADHVGRGGRAQPVGQLLFAAARARRAEQLEQRAGAEQI